MTNDASHSQTPTPDASAQKNATPQDDAPALAHLDAALAHVDAGVRAGSIAAGAARGLLYSLVETLGALVGDPDLPEQVQAGYEGLLETARELRARLER